MPRLWSLERPPALRVLELSFDIKTIIYQLNIKVHAVTSVLDTPHICCTDWHPCPLLQLCQQPWHNSRPANPILHITELRPLHQPLHRTPPPPEILPRLFNPLPLRQSSQHNPWTQPKPLAGSKSRTPQCRYNQPWQPFTHRKRTPRFGRCESSKEEKRRRHCIPRRRKCKLECHFPRCIFHTR